MDVSETYALKTKALAQYESVFETGGDKLLALYEAEDLHMGRLIGTRYAEIFKTCAERSRSSRAPLVVEDPTVTSARLSAGFGPAPHG